jgi:hypothetical protein
MEDNDMHVMWKTWNMEDMGVGFCRAGSNTDFRQTRREFSSCSLVEIDYLEFRAFEPHYQRIRREGHKLGI